MTRKEPIQHQRIVQQLCRNLIKNGCPPNEIRISGIQNPDIEGWANHKGIVVGKKQEFDILHPKQYSMEKSG